jgi:hypothetical protein
MALERLTQVTSAGINTSITITIQNISASGIITATSFRGDGSQLTGITGGGGSSTAAIDLLEVMLFS